MPELKPISKEAIPSALAKAERYRLLNEPRLAESICRDVLRTDAGNQQGLVMLLLALSDQFSKGLGAHLDPAMDLVRHLSDEYERAYYEGVVLERWATALLERGTPRYVVDDWLRKAMSRYEAAEAIRPLGNDEAILRWNTCARGIKQEPDPQSQGTEATPVDYAGGFDDEVPVI